MSKTLFRLLLLSVLFQGTICFGEEWFFGTWYFDRDFTSNQIDNVISNVPLPKPDKEYLSEYYHTPGAYRELEDTIYVFSSNNITLTTNQKVYTMAYKIVGKPNTNEVILKYTYGWKTNAFCLTNGLLELKPHRGQVFGLYYSRKPAVTVTNSVSQTSSQRFSNSSPADIEAELRRIGSKNGVGIGLVTNTHMISIITSGTPVGLKNLEQAEDAIHKFLGNDFTNYNIIWSAF